jgi:EgtB-related family protein
METQEAALTAEALAGMVADARQRTLDLVVDLTDEKLMGPQLPIINPLRWEIGHLAWFQEKWVLRHACGQPPIREDADSLYDSMAIPHDTRWDLPLLSREDTLAYLREVRDRVLKLLAEHEPSKEVVYFTLLSVFHEDMHTEAFTYSRQTLGYPPPRFAGARRAPAGPAEPGGPLPGDVSLPGGTFMLGATPAEPFVFDNEKWAHPVEVQPFAIARAPVTQAEYALFVKDDGYLRRELWSEEGWTWRQTVGAEQPAYWSRGEGVQAFRRSDVQEGTPTPQHPNTPTPQHLNGWFRRDFDRWVPLEPHRPVLQVNWHEADAYCRWAGRRLPTEAEWEMAASWDPRTGEKRRYPWGDDPPAPERANLDWHWDTSPGGIACVDVGALPAGDSPSGCRQMIGNVWEWTSTDFGPYLGFVADPYKEYSEPWFYDHKVLRGGCWTTRFRLIRNTWRNFYRPDRRDVWAGFRTCAR